MVAAAAPPPPLTNRQVAEHRVWAAVERSDRPRDADPAIGIPDTRKTVAVKAWLMGTKLTVQFPDALLAPLVLDLAKADEHERLRNNLHPRHYSRAWADKHGIAGGYVNILESYVALTRSGTPLAAELEAALETVRFYSKRYQCDPEKKWVPDVVNGRARRAAPAVDAPVYMTAEKVLRLHPAGWDLIQEAFARMERNQQQTGGLGNIQIPNIVPGVRGKVPRKIDELYTEKQGNELVFKRRNLAQMPQLPRPAAAGAQPAQVAHVGTHFGRMRPGENRVVYDRFRGEIDARLVTQFVEDMQSEIVDPSGGPPLPALSEGTARNYGLALMRALYHCIEISRTAPEGSPWKISPDMTAGELMRERIPLMEEPAHINGEGAFYTFLTTKPTPQQPYIIPGNDGAQSACHDWKQAFVHWNALHLAQRNFALNGP